MTLNKNKCAINNYEVLFRQTADYFCTAQKMKFFIKDLVTFTEEIL